MKKNYDDIGDDEIRIIGESGEKRRKPFNKLLWALLAVALLAGGIVGWLMLRKSAVPQADNEQAYFEPEESTGDASTTANKVITPLALLDESMLSEACCEVRDTMINDVGMKILIPHKAKAVLHVGPLKSDDRNIVYVAQAADIRADNGKILGAFVLAGKPLAWGLSKKGYCAIIGDSVSVGVSENSPLFEEATERGGYFFRQYPLVDRGRLVESELKNKSERRAICQRRGETFMVHSKDKESMHDFAQALVDLGVDNAVYLVGSTAYGHAVDEKGQLHEWGEPITHRIPENASYLIWQR